MRPSEIRELKEAFLRALAFSMILAILTNVLSLFWVIGGEAWFEDSYLYSPPNLLTAPIMRRVGTRSIPLPLKWKPRSTLLLNK